MAKKILYFYLIIFAADAGISFINDLVLYFTPSDTFTKIREILAYFVMIMMIPYVFVLFYIKIDRPFKFWVPVLFVFISSVIISANYVSLVDDTSLFNIFALELSPHWIYAHHPVFFLVNLSVVILQMGCAIVALREFKKRRDEVFKTDFRYLKAFSFNIGYGSFYIIMSIVSVVLMFKASAKGFLTFNMSNITSVEKIYKRDGKTIHLIPMVHVGSEKFYKDASQIDASKPTLILLEGVKDKNNLMNDFSYANNVLDAQADHFRPVAKVQVDKKLPVSKLSYLVADLDASEFDPQTRKYLNKTLKRMENKSFFEFLSGDNEISGPAVAANLAVDIIEKRNQKVLSELKKHEAKFETFYIPWGALHMPDIEREIIKQGYKLVQTNERAVFSLQDIFKGKAKAKPAEVPSVELSKILKNDAK